MKCQDNVLYERYVKHYWFCGPGFQRFLALGELGPKSQVKGEGGGGGG